jgi:alcohol dehydrogenase class IV
MTEGSLLSGTALAIAGVDAVYAFAYSRGGEFHFAHGLTHTLMLPYLMRYNTFGCPHSFARTATEAAINIARLPANDSRKTAFEDADTIHNAA